MRQEGHLQVFDLILKTKSPVFIGCGKSYTKKEYLFDPKRHIVSFLDERAMFTYLAEHNLADSYESYMLGNMGRNLWDFLVNICKIPTSQINHWTRCRIDAGDALDDDHTLKEIQRFVRNGNDEIYVPGSSIKGALRTVLLKSMLLQSAPKNPDPYLPFIRNGSFEEDYFHTLSLKKGRNQNVQVDNPLNSILQGVRVSDSLPIPASSLCLTRKIDVFTDDSYNQINICRECIKPGVLIRCTVTLDQSVLRGSITKEGIELAIAAVSDHYQKTVTKRYPNASNYMNPRTILLGGGIGFQSKTVTDPYYGAKALDITSEILGKAFPKHNHKKDIAEGISPRALKETDFNGAAYSYGVCEVLIQ